MRLLLPPGALVGALAILAAVSGIGQAPAPPAVSETVLFDLPPENEIQNRRQLPGIAFTYHDWWTFWGSTAGWRVAVPVRRDGKWWVVGQGVSVGPYDEVEYSSFSADGSRLAVLAKAGNWHVVVDGVPGPGFDEIRQIGWSPVGQRLAYAGRRGGVWRLVENGVERGDYQEIAWIRFSLDGSRLLYGARRGNRWVLVANGIEGPEWDQIWNPVFSPDGGRVAYGGRRGSDWRVVVDGREGPPFANIAGSVFSADGKRFAYLAQLARVDNPPKVERFRGGESGDVFMKRQHPERTFIIDDPKRGPVSWWVAVADSVMGPPVASVSGPLFSATGTRMIHLAGDELQLGVFRDGRKLLDLGTTEPGLRPGETESPGDIQIRTFVTNPDGTRIMVVFDSRGRRRSVLPGAGPVFYTRAVLVDLDSLTVREGPFHRRATISGPKASPDGRHWGYEVVEEEDGFRWRVVVDLQPGPAYDQILMNSLALTSDSAVYIARRGRQFLRVAQPLGAR